MRPRGGPAPLGEQSCHVLPRTFVVLHSEPTARGEESFRRHDERMLERQHAVYHDETKLIQTTQEAARELDGIFEADREERPAEGQMREA